MIKNLAKCIITFFIFFLLNLNLYSQVIQEWAVTYNGIANDRDFASDIVTDNFGNVYVTGRSENFHNSISNFDIATLKYNSNGLLQDVRIYNGKGNTPDFGNAIALDPLGNVCIAGFIIRSEINFDYITIKYNSTDTSLIWDKTYDGAQKEDVATKMTIDDSGNVYVIGYSSDINFQEYIVTIKYNSLGVQKWQNSYSNGFFTSANAIALDGMGNLYASGYSNGIYALIKYNAYTGDSVWIKTYNSSAYTFPSDIVIDNSGNIYLTATSSDAQDIVTIKYNPNGDSLWGKTYNGPANDSDISSGIEINSLGNICVSGYSKSIESGFDYNLICYNPSGTELWVARYNGIGNGTDRTYSIGVDNIGNTYLTGESAGIGSAIDYATVKYSSSGSLMWEQRFNRIPSSSGFKTNPVLSVEQLTNSVYVAGTSNNDYVTIKYSQSPNAPTVLSFSTLGIGKLRLNWIDNSSNESKFKIYTKNNIDTNWVTKDSVPANITQWQDSGLIVGRTYSYKVYASNLAGNSEPTNIISTLITIVKNDTEIPLIFSLSQNYPNPFNPVTKIRFDIPESTILQKVKLFIYDISGKKIATLLNQEISAGSYEINWDATDFASSVYYYTLEAGDFKETKKMLLLK